MQNEEVAVVLMCRKAEEIDRPDAVMGTCGICGTAIAMSPDAITALHKRFDEVLTLCQDCVMDKARIAGIQMNWMPMTANVADALRKAWNAGNN